MPIYEYTCEKCASRFELVLCSSGEKPACPKCGSADLKKLFSTFSAGGSEKNQAHSDAGCSCCPASRSCPSAKRG